MERLPSDDSAEPHPDYCACDECWPRPEHLPPHDDTFARLELERVCGELGQPKEHWHCAAQMVRAHLHFAEQDLAASIDWTTKANAEYVATINELRAALLAARRENETVATLKRENHEMWNAIETALGHMREPFLLMDARIARTRLTEAYNTLQKSRARAALAATPEEK